MCRIFRDWGMFGWFHGSKNKGQVEAAKPEAQAIVDKQKELNKQANSIQTTDETKQSPIENIKKPTTQKVPLNTSTVGLNLGGY